MPRRRQEEILQPGDLPHEAKSHFRCEQFEPEAISIEVWHNKFLTSLRLCKVESEIDKRLYFISCLNTKVLELLVNLCNPKAIDDFTYLKVNRITSAERVKFFSCKQNGDILTEFSTKLRGAVSHCKFPVELHKQALITAFVMGINDGNGIVDKTLKFWI